MSRGIIQFHGERCKVAIVLEAPGQILYKKNDNNQHDREEDRMGNLPPIPALAQEIADHPHYDEQNSTKDRDIPQRVRNTTSTCWTTCMKTENAANSNHDNGQKGEKKIIHG